MKVYRIDCTGIPKRHNPTREEEWDWGSKRFYPHRRYSRIWLIARDEDKAIKLAKKYFRKEFTHIEDLIVSNVGNFKEGNAIIRIDGAGNNWAFVEYYNE